MAGKRNVQISAEIWRRDRRPFGGHAWKLLSRRCPWLLMCVWFIWWCGRVYVELWRCGDIILVVNRDVLAADSQPGNIYPYCVERFFPHRPAQF